MPIPPDTDIKAPDTRHALFMAGCMLVGPILFLTILSIVYTWASGFCQKVTLSGQLATALLPTAVTLGAGYLCLRELKQVHAASRDDAPLARARMVALVGLLLNGFSTFLLIGLTIPILLLRPCD